MATGNPIWDLHNGLWGLLEDATNVATLKTAGKHFTDLVQNSVRCRIKLTSATERNPMDEVESTDDFPKVAILHAKTKPRDRTASNATKLGVQWEVLIRTGDQRFDSIFDVEWAIFRQLVNWDTLKTTVTWGDTTPVKLCDMLSSEESLFDQRQNKLMRGWSAVWIGHTDLWFPHDTLIA